MCWKYFGFFLCVTSCMAAVQRKAHATHNKTTSNNAANIKAAHCWNTNAKCNGTITQSFRNSSDCCKFGGKSYIECDQNTLKDILIEDTKTTRQALCVPCPLVKIHKKRVVCTPKTCQKPDEICIEVNSTHRTHYTETYCVKCENTLGVCGSDNKTYRNECDMYQKRWRKKIYPVYYGPCRARPTCHNVKCKTGHKCTSKNGYPKCAEIPKPWCGSDGVTYASLEDLKKAHRCKRVYSHGQRACPGVSVAVEGPTCPHKKRRRIMVFGRRKRIMVFGRRKIK